MQLRATLLSSLATAVALAVLPACEDNPAALDASVDAPTDLLDSAQLADAGPGTADAPTGEPDAPSIPPDGGSIPPDAAPGVDSLYLSSCGDGFCDRDEDCTSCVDDCEVCPPGCNDNSCEPLEGEACSNCPGDCVCGEGTCQDAWDCAKGCAGDATCETNCVQSACYEAQLPAADLLACLTTSCPDQCADMASITCTLCTLGYCASQAAACYGASTCGPQSCGDSTCQPEEDCVSCPGDCGACPDLCGDDTCQPAEDCVSCPGDCGVCCGNGVCAPDETCETCADDCGTCPPLCGDTFCEPFLGENCTNCPGDCECGGDTCGQVMLCFFACTDLVCANSCLSAGCQNAQTQAQAVVTCAATSCLMSCLNPSDPGCTSCLTSSCADEMTTCALGGC